jgi:hypothetical protein
VTEKPLLNDAEIETAKNRLDEISKVMIDSMTLRGVHASHIERALARLDPMYVSPAFVESVERSYFRTNSDTGANSNALAIWGRVRDAAGMDRLTMDGLAQRTVDMYYADAQRAEDAGDYENADKYRAIARRVAAENTDALARERERVAALTSETVETGASA